MPPLAPGDRQHERGDDLCEGRAVGGQAGLLIYWLFTPFRWCVSARVTVVLSVAVLYTTGGSRSSDYLLVRCRK